VRDVSRGRSGRKGVSDREVVRSSRQGTECLGEVGPVAQGPGSRLRSDSFHFECENEDRSRVPCGLPGSVICSIQQ